MQDRLQLAIEIAARAGRRIAHDFEAAAERPENIATKSSAIDLVTPTDRAAEALILAAIREAFPDDAVLAEESGAAQGRPGAPRWIVDPLDGTTNFAHRFPHVCVSIAVAEGDDVKIGVVHDPLRIETFIATAGGGAWLHRADAAPRRLAVSGVASLDKSLLATGFGYDRGASAHDNVAEFSRVIRRVHGIRRAGSAALDLAWVAAARLDGYWEYGLAPWDWAAGLLIVREAGGEATTIDGRPFVLGATSLCVADAALLPELLAALQGV